MLPIKSVVLLLSDALPATAAAVPIGCATKYGCLGDVIDGPEGRCRREGVEAESALRLAPVPASLLGVLVMVGPAARTSTATGRARPGVKGAC
mmetsp:Transcript_153430/g.272023  ORF Transcript_153430/g.272023 Transcript_153430/m.272023 type:complete len:93 (-) Transcript_153430:370-648(-)